MFLGSPLRCLSHGALWARTPCIDETGHHFVSFRNFFTQTLDRLSEYHLVLSLARCNLFSESVSANTVTESIMGTVVHLATHLTAEPTGQSFQCS